MNLVGKIFTVLIFVMCIVFASFTLMTHAGHKNWRSETVELTKKLDQANKELDDRQKEVKRIAAARLADKDHYEKDIGKLKGDNKTLTESRDEAESKYNKLVGDLRKAIAETKLVTQNLQAANLERDELRTTNKVLAAQIQTVFDHDVVAATVADNLKTDLAAAQKQLANVAELYKSAKMLLDWMGIREADKNSNPPAGLSGVVTAVQQNYVEISLGSDDGIRKGHRFAVTRPNTGSYVGDIEVIKVDWPNRAVCQPLKATQRDQIQKGDYVQANLSKGLSKGS